MTTEERNGMIDTLVYWTQIEESYYKAMTDKRLAEEYDRLMAYE